MTEKRMIGALKVRLFRAGHAMQVGVELEMNSDPDVNSTQLY